MGDVPAGPVVRMLRSHCWGQGSLPGQGAKISQAEQPKKKKQQQQPQDGLVTIDAPKASRERESRVSTFHADHACKHESHSLLFSRVQFQQLRTFV